MANPVKPYGQRPFDPGWADQSNNWGDWVTSALNQLIGQNKVPPAKGFPSLSVPVVDPTSNQITSAGNRVASIITDIIFVASSTSVQFFWDGTNGSQVFRIARDDGSVYTNPAGSGLLCTGLSPSTLYFFYPYFNEAQQVIQFASVPGISVGSPSIAFTSPNLKGAQTQILRGNLLVAINLATNGITTPASGTNAPASGGSGGGGVGGGPNRGHLL